MPMKPLGILHPTEWGPIVAASIQNFVTTAASSAYAADWGAASAGSSNPRYVDIHSEVICYFDPATTGVQIPSSNMTSGSSGFSMVLPNQPFRRMIPGGSTGYSIATPSSGRVTVAQWGA